MLPLADGGPWGEWWRPHSAHAPAPRELPSGARGDEYRFAVRPLSRALASRFGWTWSADARSLRVPGRDVHRELGFPRPYVISPAFWTDGRDIVATTWRNRS